MSDGEGFTLKKSGLGNIRLALTGRKTSLRGQMLGSLARSELCARFYSWHVTSGAHYVCSVFPDDEAIVAGFSNTFVIGVRHKGAARLPICILFSNNFASERCRLLREDARSLGVNEWHIHFGEGDAELRDLTLQC